jgi:hypothetical protein
MIFKRRNVTFAQASHVKISPTITIAQFMKIITFFPRKDDGIVYVQMHQKYM